VGPVLGIILAMAFGLPAARAGGGLPPGSGSLSVSAILSGWNEAPSVLTSATGTFTAMGDGTSITYTLTYSGLSSAVLQAHLQFAQSAVNGGIIAFLCSNLGNGPAGTPACPDSATHSGTVTGMLTAAQIVNLSASQGLSAGNFAGALQIIHADRSYVNVDSANFPAGEIRGCVAPGTGLQLPLQAPLPPQASPCASN
jgi:hypothetical protein